MFLALFNEHKTYRLYHSVCKYRLNQRVFSFSALVRIPSRTLAERELEHLAATGTGKELLDYYVINGATGLSKTEARIIEQTLINDYGLGKSRGQLLNKINSIAEKYWGQLGIPNTVFK